MSEKYPGSYNRPHERESNNDYLSTEEFNTKIEAKLNGLEEKYWQCRDHLRHIELKTRIEQVAKLGRAVYFITKYDTAEESISLDDKTQWLVKNPLVDAASGYPVFDEDAEEAFERGVIKGTNDILSILAPDEEFKNVYFLRWRLDLLRAKTGDNLTVLSDGYANLSLPTTLPNIEIDYFYRPSSDMPQRTIYYRG